MIVPGHRHIDQPTARQEVLDLVAACGGDPQSRDGRLVADVIVTALKLITDERDTGELKLLTHSFKEIRHAMRVFARYRGQHMVSIFGSARTPPEHPDYHAAVQFSRLMAERGWLSITGAGDGIMKAGHEGPGAAGSFGLAIRLPFETTANSVIDGDDKLVHFRYFFTRKLMFLSQCHAVASFPGGFGTHDELLETLTMIQTGKSPVIPVVLIAGRDSDYWRHWERNIRGELLSGGFISPEDLGLFHLADSPLDAAEHIGRFYANYHSQRYVGDDLVIRIRTELTPVQLELINEEFGGLVVDGSIEQCEAYPQEQEFEWLPRIAFTHTRRSYGAVRRLIDRINDCGIANRLGVMPDAVTSVTEASFAGNYHG
ncbi:MAG: LOG family protein [Actinobacteria bacterium]|nr:LOG family protein [Actinomycetota bacterium]